MSITITVYSSQPYDEQYLRQAGGDFNWHFVNASLNSETVELARGSNAVCIFVNDLADRTILSRFNELGVRVIALRCAGFNNVDVSAAKELGLQVARVPAYSPEAVAEHCVAMILFYHFAINIGMNIGFAPVIGIPLPFFSYGGSSMMSFSVMMFILLKLDAQRKDVLR